MDTAAIRGFRNLSGNACYGRLMPRGTVPTRMERYGCAKCDEEFFMKNVPMTGPPSGPHFCPECGGELHWLKTEFGWIPNSYDMD
jgi:hypothetical protein